MAEESQGGLKWGDPEHLQSLVSGLAEIGAGSRIFDELASATEEAMIEKLVKLHPDDLRRVVLAQVVLEQQRRRLREETPER